MLYKYIVKIDGRKKKEARMLHPIVDTGQKKSVSSFLNVNNRLKDSTERLAFMPLLCRHRDQICRSIPTLHMYS